MFGEGEHGLAGATVSEDEFSWREGRVISWHELTFRSDTSGGPGGQHANRSSTRVTLLWCPADSAALSHTEKARLQRALAARLSRDGILRIRSSTHRSARRNKQECLEILGELLRNALRPKRRRIPTRPSGAAKERRLEAKHRRSQIKDRRRPPGPE